MNNIGNRNSTPEAGSAASLRPPPSATRTTFGAGHNLRQSADMAAAHSSTPMSSRGIRPASEVIHGQRGHPQGAAEDLDNASKQWLADIDSYEDTLEQMAAATLDQDFKDELSAIEQWFRVLSEAERTAALYALLQQTTQVQTRFFIATLQQMARNHPVSGVISPSGFGDKDPMSNRLSGAMDRLSVGGPSRNSMNSTRPPPSPGAKRASGLEQTEINSMFPDAVAAIARQKADFTEKTGTEPRSNRSSAVVVDRSSTVGAPGDSRKDGHSDPPLPWGQQRSQDSGRPKSSQGQQPMGQFAQAPSASLHPLRSATLKRDTQIPGPLASPAANPDGMAALMSPYTGNWGSVQPTPMDANFSNFQTNPNQNQANMVANATAMKLAALSTVTNRVQLDDARKFRRSRSTEGNGNAPPTPSFMNNGFAMMNEHGQLLSPQQAAVLQAQQLAAMQGRAGRGNSPGSAMSGQFPTGNGLLSPESIMNGVPTMGAMGQFGAGFGGDFHEERGRSPRGKRGTSRPPPEDPTDAELLKDIPAWLRSLRLHKYTDNLKDLKWQDLVQLDEKGLEDRGVAAKGARTKMLKVFQEVREAQTSGKI